MRTKSCISTLISLLFLHSCIISPKNTLEKEEVVLYDSLLKNNFPVAIDSFYYTDLHTFNSSDFQNAELQYTVTFTDSNSQIHNGTNFLFTKCICLKDSSYEFLFNHDFRGFDHTSLQLFLWNGRPLLVNEGYSCVVDWIDTFNVESLTFKEKISDTSSTAVGCLIASFEQRYNQGLVKHSLKGSFTCPVIPLSNWEINPFYYKYVKMR